VNLRVRFFAPRVTHILKNMGTAARGPGYTLLFLVLPWTRCTEACPGNSCTALASRFLLFNFPGPFLCASAFLTDQTGVCCRPCQGRAGCWTLGSLSQPSLENTTNVAFLGYNLHVLMVSIGFFFFFCKCLCFLVLGGWGER
jgi:hypothetical protein